jgi:hypothetical protein
LDGSVGAFGRDAWREATTRQADACKEERQSQAPARMRQQTRSELTGRVSARKEKLPVIMRIFGQKQAVN